METTAEIAPMEYTRDPTGVLHLIEQDPIIFDTLCGTSIRTKPGEPGWTIGDETVSGMAATCFVCWVRRDRLRKGQDEHGNAAAEEGCDRCPCGSKYWEHDTCIDCGTPWHPSFREDDSSED